MQASAAQMSTSDVARVLHPAGGGYSDYQMTTLTLETAIVSNGLYLVICHWPRKSPGILVLEHLAIKYFRRVFMEDQI